LIKNGVFNQVFAYTYEGLTECLNDEFNKYVYANDMDGERERIKGLDWEQEYVEIYQTYSKNVCYTIWEDDKACSNDMELRDFATQLNDSLPNGLPKRYRMLKKKR